MSLDEKEFVLNRDRKIISGVCSGLADYFSISAFWIRLAFVFAALTWVLTFLVYLVLYFIMHKKSASPKEFADDLVDSKIGRRIKSFNFKKSIYKNSKRGKIKGVCYGVAQYFEIDPLFIRLAALGSLFFGPLAIILYVLATFLLDEEPAEYELFVERADEVKKNTKFRSGSKNTQSSRASGEPLSAKYYSENLEEIDVEFSKLERKLRNLEATVTSKKFKLQGEFKRMSN